MRLRGTRIATAALLAAAVVLPAADANARPHPLTTGFSEPLFASADASVRDLWLGRARAAGARIARINVDWSSIAPALPPQGFDAANPGSPGYDWSALDATLRSAAARRVRVLITVLGAPTWAEGPGRPAGARPGTWRPQPEALGAFAQALAARYSGGYPDPLAPGLALPLPRVRLFQPWNEPNLDFYLAPQWQGGTLVGPEIYRPLLNSFYAGVKAAQPGATVLSGGTGPFGDPPGGSRTPPVLFLRALLCLRGGRLVPVACPQRARFDVLAHQPIAVGAPRQAAQSLLDATTPDLGRMTRVLRKAERTGRVRPGGRRPLWVTEFAYDSNPPDPQGVPIATQARWYQQALYLFWRQGARAVIALQVRDSDPEPLGFPFTTQAGLFLTDGTAKPSLTAFRFPLVGQRLGPGKVRAWGIAPRAGRVKVQALRGGGWQTLARLRAGGPSHPFEATLALRGPAKLRARQGGRQSLVWDQG